MQRQPSLPVTTEDVAEFRRSVLTRFPTGGPVMTSYAVANEIVLNVFGPAWWAERLAGDGADPYFVKGRTDDPGRYLHQHRVIGLARDLLRCQYAPGFREQLDVMRTRSLVGLFHELRVARMLLDNRHTVEFKVPRESRAPDLLIDRELSVEVKAKEDDSLYKRSSLESTLADARRQLPRRGPGLIALRVPDHWSTDSTFAAEADAVFERWLTNTRRVNAVLILWDHWVPAEPQGMACTTLFRVHENGRPHSPVTDLGQIVKAITGPVQSGG
jgi:hypothetical protein